MHAVSKNSELLPDLETGHSEAGALLRSLRGMGVHLTRGTRKGGPPPDFWKISELGERRIYNESYLQKLIKSKKVKLFLCFTNYALRHDGLWGVDV
jgi:hypothetical protein